MRIAACLAATWLLTLVSPAAAQSVPTVISPGPQHVAVTVYRNPARGRYDPIDLRYLQGFALVTETRTVRLPRGPAVLRLEGVAEGIVPVSAIITGLPGGTVEKNRDARLLSPVSLIDGTLGRTVTLTRTDRATGVRRREEATIVAGPAQGVVLRTAAGIETLRCAGLPEALAFAAVPAGLSAQPVLSVVTDTPSASTVTVTLSYLTSGFDWGASYVATLTPNGKTLDLFAWLTLANGNPERFAEASVKAVAGRLNRTATDRWMRDAAALELHCYPLGTTTSDLRLQTFELAEAFAKEEGQDIVVTASRVMAPAPAAPPAPSPPPPPEDLGDLKLYTVPRAVTVAARAQKQVALLMADGVPFERRYRRRLSPGQTLAEGTTDIVLVIRNRQQDRLGLPLPAGTTALYAGQGAGRLLLGTGTLGDYAIGQTLRLAAGVSAQVRVAQQPLKGGEALVTVTNANRQSVRIEIPIGSAGRTITADGALTPVDGVATWIVDVPAHDSVRLTYRHRR